MIINLCVYFLGLSLRGRKLSSTSACWYLKAPLVADLSVQIQVHFHHQQSVPGPGEARGAAAVRSGHVAGSVEMPEVVVSWQSGERVGQTPPTPGPQQTKPLPFFPSPDVNSLLKRSCGEEKEGQSHVGAERHRGWGWGEGGRSPICLQVRPTPAGGADSPSPLC